jgi:hypothetical protein
MKGENIMKPQSKLFLSVFFGTFFFCLILSSYSVFGQDFVPPVPDKSKTLPANDGRPDGCGSSRFDCVLGGEAVLDKATGLVWARNIKFKQKAVSWEDAVKFCQNFEIDGKTGWRLPARDEFISVLDTSQSHPAFPEGSPFIVSGAEQQGGAGSSSYWTSTEYENNKESAWGISIKFGKVYHSLKIFDLKVWPVRDSE